MNLMIKAPIDDMKAMTILLVTTVFIGNLNKTNNTGIIINAPPAPTMPDTTPIPNPTKISKTGLNLTSWETDLTLTNINNNATMAMIIYIVFIKVALNKLASIAPNMLPITIPPPIFITSLGENSAFFLALNEPLSVLKNTWLEVRPEAIYAL